MRKSIHEIEENNGLPQLAHSEMLARESIVKQKRAVLLSNNLLKSELYGLQEDFHSMRISSAKRIQNLEEALADDTRKNALKWSYKMCIEIESMKKLHAKKFEISFSEIGEVQSNFKMTRFENPKDSYDCLWIS